LSAEFDAADRHLAPTAPAFAAWVDRPKPLRDADAIDTARLDAWLAEHLTGLADADAASPLLVEQFPSGYSNLTFALTKGTTKLVLRRPPFAVQVKSGHDMGREHRVLTALRGHFAPAPRSLAICTDEAVIGAPFFVMERREGLILRQPLPKGLELSPAMLGDVCRGLVDTLVALHRLDVTTPPLSELGKPAGFVRRQLEGWRARWEKARIAAVPAMEALAEWLTDNLPDEQPPALVHNDYKFDNVVLSATDPTQIVGVLDWEMATLGDPRMDLGASLAYWVEGTDDPRLQFVALGPTWCPGAWTRAQVAARWAAGTGRDISDLPWFRCFGTFKNAVIAQQIFWRYEHGHTRDPRFAALGHLVVLMAESGLDAARSGSL
jgi:aminoglycoside phosphotransferase (APT) family kinase protein